MRNDSSYVAKKITDPNFLLQEADHYHIMGAAYLVNMISDKRINERFVPAMGYAPLDKPPSYFKGKVNYVNQTQWLFEHSGMRIPSKDLMQHIYEDQVMSKKVGIKHFGSYP